VFSSMTSVAYLIIGSWGRAPTIFLKRSLDLYHVRNVNPTKTLGLKKNWDLWEFDPTFLGNKLGRWVEKGPMDRNNCFLGGGNSNIFYFYHYLREMIQFD